MTDRSSAKVPPFSPSSRLSGGFFRRLSCPSEDLTAEGASILDVSECSWAPGEEVRKSDLISYPIDGLTLQAASLPRTSTRSHPPEPRAVAAVREESEERLCFQRIRLDGPEGSGVSESKACPLLLAGSKSVKSAKSVKHTMMSSLLILWGSPRPA